MIGSGAAIALATTGIVVGLSSSPAMAAGTGTGYLSTNGSRIVDSTGATVRITGLNWFGMETDNKTFHGLWASVTWKAQIDHMAQLGYNTIRVPYSNDALKSGAAATGINDFTNPDLIGKTPMQILDLVVDYAGSKGMRIILDRHRPDAGSQSKLWYRGEPSDSARSAGEAVWINDWKWLAQHYAGNTTVIGADLHNEPHAEGTHPQGTGACWGCGDINRDWRLAAERAGNAIHSVNPNWLIFVEGVSCPSGGVPNVWDGDTSNDERCGWWGGNLSQVRDYPVRLNKANKLVYSPHEYGVSVYLQSWFEDPSFPSTLPPHWDYMFGYIAKDGIAPIMMGEFGSTLADPRDATWLKNLMSYLTQNGMSFTYWSWNPNSGDTGGIVQDDWVTVQQAKQSILQPHLVPPSGGGQTSTRTTTTTTTTTSPRTTTTTTSPRTTTTTTSPRTTTTTTSGGGGGSGGCSASFALTNSWQGGFQGDVKVTNTGTSAINGWTVTMTLPSGATLAQLWNGSTTISGSTVTVKNLAWNGALGAGASTGFGFLASGSGTPTFTCTTP